jgi:hypothetical protein
MRSGGVNETAPEGSGIERKDQTDEHRRRGPRS